MLAIELASEVIPAIQTKDKAAEVLNWMDVFRVSHLPIVENGKYIGIISDADIFDTNEPTSSVIDHQLSLSRPFVYDNQHIYEVISEVAKHKLSLIPVLNKEEEYLGIIRGTDLALEFSHLMSIENPGGIITLELNLMDYSLSEIAQIIEGNDAKILSLYTSTPKDQNKIEVTLKINRSDLSAILQTFERYSYQVKAVYANNGEVDNLMKDRLDSFFKYLNV